MTTITHPVFEIDEDVRDHEPAPVPLIVTLSDSGIAIEVRNGDGHGLVVANILVELERGRVRALIWDHTSGEGNDGDPTQIVELVPNARAAVAAEPDFGDDDDDPADSDLDDSDLEGEEWKLPPDELDDDEEREVDL